MRKEEIKNVKIQDATPSKQASTQNQETRPDNHKGANSEYVEESGLVLDYDKDGNMVAVEIISYSKRVGKEELVEAIAI